MCTPTVLNVCVRDDGVGGADPNRGSGLLGLKDRPEAIGGSLSLESARGAGTSLYVELPLDDVSSGLGGRRSFFPSAKLVEPRPHHSELLLPAREVGSEGRIELPTRVAAKRSAPAQRLRQLRSAGETDDYAEITHR